MADNANLARRLYQAWNDRNFEEIVGIHDVGRADHRRRLGRYVSGS